MKRKVAILILSVMHLALSVAAQAQQQAKIHKIGFLGTRPASGTTGISGGVAGFPLTRILRDLGYVEGKNITFEYRSADISSTCSLPWLMNW